MSIRSAPAPEGADRVVGTDGRSHRRRAFGRPRALAWAATVAAMAVATAIFRFLGLRNGFPNDHFVYLTPGWLMQFGEWPTRDFVDPGLPLMFIVSGLAQAVYGPTLLGEAVVVAVAFGLAVALTMVAVRDLTGSRALAILAAVLEVAIYPRTYSYPKVLAYAAAFWVFGRYVRRPSNGWLCAVAGSVAVAFLFRHDHGLFLYVGALLLVALVDRQAGARAIIRRALLLSGVLGLLLLPYFVYVQAHAGLDVYLQTGLEYSRREADRQPHVWPSLFGGNLLQAALVYELHALPLAAGVALAAGWWRGSSEALARVAPVAVVALLVNISFIRDPLTTRLPDVIVPAVMLGAWLTSLALKDHPRRIARTATAIVIGAVVGASVLSVGSVAEEANRAGLLADWRRLPERFGERVRQLQDRPWEFQMTPTVRALRPFLAYVTRCTTIEDRLLSVGFPPDVFFFARRLVAGGQTYFGSFGNVEAQQRRVVARLERQRVPFVLVPSDFAGEFDERFPTVAAYVRAHFVPMSRVPVDDDVQMQIYLNRDLPYFSRDPDTGFPCYFQNGHSSPVDGRR